MLSLGDEPGQRLQKYIGNPWSFAVLREFMVQEGLNSSPTLRRLDSSIEAQERSLLSAKLDYALPTLSLGFNLDHRLWDGGAAPDMSALTGAGFPTADATTWAANLMLSWNLLEGGAKYHTHKQTHKQLSRLKTQRLALVQSIEQQVRNAMHQTGSSFPCITLSKASAEAARKSLELVTDAYSRGARSIIDLIDAQNAALGARLSAAVALYNFLTDLVAAQHAVANRDFFLAGKKEHEAWLERLDSMSRPHINTFSLLLAAISAAGLSGCPGEAPKPPKEVIRPVRTIKVFSLGGDRPRRFSGVTQAGMESKLSFKVAGTVQAKRVKVGQAVKKDQLLAELDDKDLRLEVQRAQASHAQARAQMVNARAAYDRTRKLYETQNASKSDLDSARAGAASSRANVAAAAKQIELARSRLTYAKLRSPTDGVISMVAVEVNEHVKSGKAVVAITAKAALPEVKVAVPEVYIAMIKPKDRVKVFIDALKGKELDARVTEVGVASETVGSTYPVVVSIPEPTPEIRPGMAAEVAFKLGGPGGQERFVVPPVAVSQDKQGRYVYVAQATQPAGHAVVKRRAVEIGELSSRGLEVKKGLKDGDLLITAGASQIRDGLRVKLLGEAKK
jgi:RND family efflux transporter MFP subunit